METIVPSVLFGSPPFGYQRERLELQDGDFLDLDWLNNDNDRLIIISHGMEGSSDRYYIRRMAHYFHKTGWDALAWNTRGCSGELNRLPVITHHGFYRDLQAVTEYALQKKYDQIVLIGMSMGGNLSAKYLSLCETDDRLKGAVTFSVTGNMKGMTNRLELFENWIYKQSFLKKLKDKIEQVSKLHPKAVKNRSELKKVHTFEVLHELFSVPMNGFKNLETFYSQASANTYLGELKKPVLMVNALNDPILSKDCFPYEIAEKQSNLYLETPKTGGHLGFNFVKKPYSYMEKRAEAFIHEVLM